MVYITEGIKEINFMSCWCNWG